MVTDPIRISPPQGHAPIRVLRGLPRTWRYCAHGADREPAQTVGDRGDRAGLRISLSLSPGGS